MSNPQILDVYTASSYTTSTGKSYCPFILYATMNTDPNVIGSTKMPLKSPVSFCCSQGQPNLCILIPIIFWHQKHEQRLSYHHTTYPTTYNSNQLILEYATLIPGSSNEEFTTISEK